ncbi:MAG: glutamate-5-semialdehyde dehydrogenase [Myxococcales bacterium]|nr:glutamate-5-semialdehyde dehydrogenase [Myxococcales bacterium]
MTDLDLHALATAARAASRAVAKAPAAQRQAALVAIAGAVRAQADAILAANRADLDGAAARGLAPAMIDRLRLDPGRLEAIARAVDEIAGQPELIGRLEREEVRPNGLRIARMRIPLGVIAIVYEARPNVTVDAAALCLKAGNACILRGGSEAFHSNQALGAAVAAGLAAAGLPAAAVTVVPSTDRDAIRALVGLEGLVDLVIPRGGEGLIRFVAEHARVPVIKHYKGVCHLYVHADADLDMAVAIADNGKVSRPGVCNALETILIDRAVAPTLVPRLCAHLGSKGVEIRGDAEVVRLGGAGVRAATAEDWDAEYLELKVAMAVVDDLDAAIAHIERHGSDHTETIVTRDDAAAARFLAEVGSSTVMHNASTRFADGGELGLGAEIGISTTRLHAYGPMGAEGLTTSKFIVRGTGQIR